MSDQKKWFKVWTSILSDDDFDPDRGLVSIGRFTMLGAYAALHGQRGVVEIMPDTLFRLTQAASLDELRCDLACKNMSFEEGKNRHGKITVTWSKWVKFQEDSTQAQRAKTSRSKRRREERRSEEIRTEEKKESPPLTPPPNQAPTARPLSDQLKTAGERIWKLDKTKYNRLWEWISKQRKAEYSDSLLAQVLTKFEPYAGDNSISWWGYLDTILTRESQNGNERASMAESERFKEEERKWLENQTK